MDLELELEATTPSLFFDITVSDPKTAETKTFVFSEKMLELSTLFKTMLELDKDATSFNCTCNIVIFEKIFYYLVQSFTEGVKTTVIPKNVQVSTLERTLQEWEWTFLKENTSVILEMIEVVNYLGIDNCSKLCSSYIQTLMQGKTAKETQEFFNVEIKVEVN